MLTVPLAETCLISVSAVSAVSPSAVSLQVYHLCNVNCTVEGSQFLLDMGICYLDLLTCPYLFHCKGLAGAEGKSYFIQIYPGYTLILTYRLSLIL